MPSFDFVTPAKQDVTTENQDDFLEVQVFDLQKKSSLLGSSIRRTADKTTDCFSQN